MRQAPAGPGRQCAARKLAALGEVDAGKLPVSVVELVADRTEGLRPAAADLGFSELKAVGLLDAHTMLGAGDWIENRLPTHVQHAVNMRARPTRVDIDLILDVGEDGIVQRFAGGCEDLKHGGAGLGVVAPQDVSQSLALLGSGPLVDDVQALATGLVNRSRPAEYARRPQAVEPDRAVKARLNVVDGKPAAIAVGRQRIELAGAAIVAIAIAEFGAPNLPFDHPKLS
jgi:hypothetical protein